jgi:uncharacterized membrane protein YfcA
MCLLPENLPCSSIAGKGSYSMENLILFILIGFISGIFTGFFGVGGGFFLTPVLNIFGLQIVSAIGTAFFALVGKSLFAAWRYRRLGNIHLKLGIILGLSSIGGVEIGKRSVLFLERQNLAEASVGIAYILILITTSFFMLREYFSRVMKTPDGQKEKPAQTGSYMLAQIVSKVTLPPKVNFRRSELKSVSFWVLVPGGVLIGFLSGFLGCGGGFISLPLLIYVFGVPVISAVGTSLIIVLLTSSYGAFAFASSGNVDWTIAGVLIIASFLGIQLGVAAARSAPELRLKALFAFLLIFIAISVFLKQIELSILSSYVAVSSALLICFFILRRR